MIGDLATIIVTRPSTVQPFPNTCANPDAPMPFVFGRRIAQGGMGAIIEADDCKFGRKIAVKVMRLDKGASDEQKRRFVQEASVLGRLEHPNIVPVHDLGRDAEGELYYTMKLVKGRTLQDILDDLRREHPEVLAHYTLDRLLTILRKVCDALAFAHANHIIHRDLKPENIMVGEFGEVLVMDWGIAKILGELDNEESPAVTPTQFPAQSGTASFTATMDGAVMGTPNYMSPEQAMGKVNELDERSDIFSLGGILYAILTLRPPVEGKDVWEVLEKVQAANITEPTKFSATTVKGGAKTKGGVLEAKKIMPLPHMPGGRIPHALSAVAMKALTLDKTKRYQHVATFSADIEAYQNGFATSAENAGAWTQLKLLMKRHKASSIGIAAVLVVGGSLGTKALMEGRRAERALTSLKKTAPTVLSLAETEAGFQRFDSALEKLDAALALDPGLTRGYWRRAWLLLAQEKFAESAEAVRTAQVRDPANAARLGSILPLLGELHSAPPAARWNPSRSAAVLAHLGTAGASGEAVALSKLFQISAAEKVKLVNARVQQWYGGKAQPDSDGGIGVVPPKTIDTVEPLRGLPITQLNLGESRVRDLGPLHGMPLRRLDLRKCAQLTDLSPLRGMPLEYLNISETFVADLSPLQGMPLRELNAGFTKISSLAPLHGMPLESLDVSATAVGDLSPLKGMPLRHLNVTSTLVSDLSPLKGMPLEFLGAFACPARDLSPLSEMPLKELRANSNDFSPLAGMKLRRLVISGAETADISTLRHFTADSIDLNSSLVRDLKPLIGLHVKNLVIRKCTNVKDFSPLLECTELEELDARECLAPIEPLRAHKTLKIISYSSPGSPVILVKPVAEFWKEYDAQKAAGN
ncbi:protein kinase [Prosthecobacter sp.]|uniref:protein kinase domain-containing protein n=1 Tax=Prosthecobacter sp. TaxID=1965333 RepID=UPI001D3F8BE8|nr:protein kinase [Prosthecobacter sp.]MCB1276874.1 protein kinase [Prosthecobacter sp.]